MFKYYLPQQKVLREILEKIFMSKKLTQFKTSRLLKIDGFKITENNAIRKMISKYKVFLYQANSSSDLFQTLILQLSIPRASLPPLPSLSNFVKHHLCQTSLPTENPLQHNPQQLFLERSSALLYDPRQLQAKPKISFP